MAIDNIDELDNLNEGRVKLNQAIDQANTVQGQLDTIVIASGTSDAETIQARGGEPLLYNRLDKVDTQLADITNYVNVKDFGATPNIETDQTQFIEDAINHLISLGGGTLFIPSGEYHVIADENTTISPYNPKRIQIRGTMTGTEAEGNRVITFAENVHIEGDINTVIHMKGMTFEQLYNMDDYELSNVDVFCAFSFIYAKRCSISNLTIKGDYMSINTPLRYGQARAKGVSFLGSMDCSVHDIKSFNIFGNHVHSNNASNALDGYWLPSDGTRIYNCYFDTCMESGVNMTTMSYRSSTIDCTFLNCNGSGIEAPGIIKGNTIKNGWSGGIAPTGDAIVTNNIIEDVETAFYLAGRTAINIPNTIISNNFVKNIKYRFLTASAGAENLICTNNRFINSNLISESYNFMMFLAGTTDSKIKKMTIKDNYFEINNGASFVTNGIYTTNLVDSIIENNTFIFENILPVTEIYLHNHKNCVIQNNNLQKGIGQSSTSNERNVLSNNIFPLNKTPTTTDWLPATTPTTGEWLVGDFLRKKTPVITVNANGTNRIEFGWYCTSSDPLVWKLHAIITGTVESSLTIKKGTKTYSADGVAKTITIAHGLNALPSYFNVQKSSLNIPAIDAVSADITNLTVTFVTVPVASAYIALRWKAEI